MREACAQNLPAKAMRDGAHSDARGAANDTLAVDAASTDAASPTAPAFLDTPSGERVHPPFEWSIQRFADMFDTTPRAVRFYESKALLAPERRGRGRVFGLSDFLRLERIQRAKRLGFSLDDIREVMEVIDGEVSDAGELARRKSNFERVLRGLARRRADIDAVAADMSDLCQRIDAFTQAPRESTTFFRFATQYQDRLDRSLST